MVKFVDLMYQNTGVTIDSETPMTDYMPPINATLVKIMIEVGGIAATSLIEYGYVRLKCSAFGNVEMVAPFHGIGLETVPRKDKPRQETECSLQIKSGVPIKGSYYYNVAPVTPELMVYGVFEA